MQAAFILFSFAMALYAGATVLYGYFFLNKNRTLSWYASFLTGAGFLAHTASIGLRSTATEGTVMTGPNSLVLAAWALVLVYFIVEHVARIKVYGIALVPLAAILLMAAQLLGANGLTGSTLTAEQLHQVESWQVGIHVALIMLANAGFAIGAAASVVYLVQEAQLKAHRTSVLFRRLPSLAQTDSIARRAIAIAYPAYSAALLLGVARAMQLVQEWYFDPRVIMAGITWAIFGAYLYLRYRTNVSGRSAAWLAIVGLIAVAVLGILARLGIGSFHDFGGLG